MIDKNGKVKLATHQLQFIKSEAPIAGIYGGRGCGKTVALSWLVATNLINGKNQIVYGINFRQLAETIVPEVIKRLDLTNVICTWDALNTQKDNVKAVISKKGDYCVALKANQGNFYKDVQDYFDEDKMLLIQSGYEGGYQLSREKNHEAIITYEYYQTEDIKWYEEYKKWDGLRSIGLIKKTIENSDGTKTEEKRYYISSLLLNIQLFSYAIRKHWNVENKLHWQMDFTFKSDDNTTMNKKALFNLQIIKKFCLKILNIAKEEKKKSLKRIRKDISRNVEKELIEIFKLMRNFDMSTINKY